MAIDPNAPIPYELTAKGQAAADALNKAGGSGGGKGGGGKAGK